MPSTKIFSTLNDLVRSSAARGDAAALIALGSTGTRIWSYRELVQSIARLAAGLRRAGLERGEPVLLLGPNSPEWVATYFAIIGAGGMVVPLDDLSDTHEVARVLADSGSRRVFTTQSHVSTVREFDRTLEVTSLDEGGDDGTSWQNNSCLSMNLILRRGCDRASDWFARRCGRSAGSWSGAGSAGCSARQNWRGSARHGSGRSCDRSR